MEDKEKNRQLWESCSPSSHFLEVEEFQCEMDHGVQTEPACEPHVVLGTGRLNLQQSNYLEIDFILQYLYICL